MGVDRRSGTGVRGETEGTRSRRVWYLLNPTTRQHGNSDTEDHVTLVEDGRVSLSAYAKVLKKVDRQCIDNDI